MSLLLFVYYICSQLTGWQLLSDIEIESGVDTFTGEVVDKPRFSDYLLSQEGQEMTLEGYIIPLEQEGMQDYFILSRFPYQSCFFCGGAGPETVIEVFAQNKIQYTDKKIEVRGILKLNHDNPLQLFYMLKQCSIKSIGG